jgi:hypothetical protein
MAQSHINEAVTRALASVGLFPDVNSRVSLSAAWTKLSEKFGKDLNWGTWKSSSHSVRTWCLKNEVELVLEGGAQARLFISILDLSKVLEARKLLRPILDAHVEKLTRPGTQGSMIAHENYQNSPYHYYQVAISVGVQAPHPQSVPV